MALSLRLVQFRSLVNPVSLSVTRGLATKKKKSDAPEIEEGSLLEEVFPAIKAYAVSPFDETIELIVKTTIKRGEVIRGKIKFPHDTNKRNNILVFAQGEKAEEATKAGAGKVGGEELIEQVLKGEKLKGFDMAFCTPNMLKVVAKAARELGKRGLMPQAKRGTVVENIGETVKDAVDTVFFKTDRTGVSQLGIGKVSMPFAQIQDNVVAYLQTLKASSTTEDDFGNKKIRKKVFESIYVKSTFGPCFQLKASQFKIEK